MVDVANAHDPSAPGGPGPGEPPGASNMANKHDKDVYSRLEDLEQQVKRLSQQMTFFSSQLSRIAEVEGQFSVMEDTATRAVGRIEHQGGPKLVAAAAGVAGAGAPTPPPGMTKGDHKGIVPASPLPPTQDQQQDHQQTTQEVLNRTNVQKFIDLVTVLSTSVLAQQHRAEQRAAAAAERAAFSYGSSTAGAALAPAGTVPGHPSGQGGSSAVMFTSPSGRDNVRQKSGGQKGSTGAGAPGVLAGDHYVAGRPASSGAGAAMLFQPVGTPATPSSKLSGSRSSYAGSAGGHNHNSQQHGQQPHSRPPQPYSPRSEVSSVSSLIFGVAPASATVSASLGGSPEQRTQRRSGGAPAAAPVQMNWTPRRLHQEYERIKAKQEVVVPEERGGDQSALVPPYERGGGPANSSTTSTEGGRNISGAIDQQETVELPAPNAPRPKFAASAQHQAALTSPGVQTLATASPGVVAVTNQSSSASSSSSAGGKAPPSSGATGVLLLSNHDVASNLHPASGPPHPPLRAGRDPPSETGNAPSEGVRSYGGKHQGPPSESASYVINQTGGPPSETGSYVINRAYAIDEDQRSATSSMVGTGTMKPVTMVINGQAVQLGQGTWATVYRMERDPERRKGMELLFKCGRKGHFEIVPANVD